MLCYDIQRKIFICVTYKSACIEMTHLDKKVKALSGEFSYFNISIVITGTCSLAEMSNF